MGDQLDYGMRIYDPRVGRFLSVDPITAKYPWYTPYQFAGNKPIWTKDLDGKEELIYTNNIWQDEKFGKAMTLALSTNMGIKAVTQIWNTDKTPLKQDVYFALSNDPNMFAGDGNHAFTLSLDVRAIDEKGHYTGQYANDKGDIIKMHISNQAVEDALEKMDFSITANKQWKNGNVSVVFINKTSDDKMSTANYSNAIYHELQAHIVRHLNEEVDNPSRNESDDHLYYSGYGGEYSPYPGQEKKGTPMNLYLKEAKDSYFNPDKKKDNAYDFLQSSGKKPDTNQTNLNTATPGTIH